MKVKKKIEKDSDGSGPVCGGDFSFYTLISRSPHRRLNRFSDGPLGMKKKDRNQPSHIITIRKHLYDVPFFLGTWRGKIERRR